MEVTRCDLLIVGTGAGAMTAALRASKAGLKVLMVEKEDMFGGASARSGGGIWIPNSYHAARHGGQDSADKAMTYFRDQTGDRFNEANVRAFIANGPEMLNFIEETSSLRFQVAMGYGDYHCEAPGGETSRVLFPDVWDGAELGKDIERLRPVLRRGRFMGMQVGILEVGLYITAARKPESILYVLKNLIKRTRDQVRAGRTLRLVGGNALVAALAAAAFRNGTELWTSAPARSLIRDGDRVIGAIVDRPQGPVRVEASDGVILATGGFPHDSRRRAASFPARADVAETWSTYPYGNAGDGIRMGEDVGAVFDADMACPVALTPVTRLEAGEGVLETSPIFFFRGAPGVISVTRRGKRFVNEARSYHDWGVGLLAATAGEPEAVAWIICDHRAIRRYGLGIIKPAPFPLRGYIKSGYLKTGATVRELADNAGIDADALERTVTAFNEPARRGEDPAFHRGSTVYEMVNGDPEHRPNPCVGPLDTGPFYAIRVTAGCIGTFAGIKANAHAQVIDAAGQAITGLYVAGNDMASITGGDYIAGGCTLGPAMTFGYIAAGHMISQRPGAAG